MPPKTQTRVIRVKVEDASASKTLQKLSNELNKLNRTTKNTSKSLKSAEKSLKSMDDRSSKLVSGLKSLKGAFLGVIAASGVRELTRMADSYQLLRDRISVFVGSQDKANEVVDQLADLAAATRSPLATLADGYNRVAIATKALNLSNAETLTIVGALQQSLRLSGASVQEANSVFLQFSQGLSLGRIQGQELRAVLLGNAVVAQILAKEFKTTTGGLKDLGAAGEITAERSVKALIREFGRLNLDASKLGTTFEQVVIVALDKLAIAAGKINDRFSLANNFAKFVFFLIDKIPVAVDALVDFAQALVSVGIAVATVKLGSAIAAITFSLSGAIAGLVKFKLALIATAETLGVLLFPFLTVKVAVVALLTVIGFLTISAFRDFNKFKLQAEVAFSAVRLAIASATSGILGFISDVLGNSFFSGGFLKKIVDNLKLVADIKLDKSRKEFEDSKKALAGYGKAATEARDILKDLEGETKDFKLKIAEESKTPLQTLNALLRNGDISAQDFRNSLANIEINKLNTDIDAGKKSLLEYDDAMAKIEKKRLGPVLDPIKELNKEFNTGKRDLQDYQEFLFAIKTDKLRKELEEGVKSKIEFDKAYKELNVEIFGEADTALQSLNKSFNAGAIGLEQYQGKLVDLKLGELQKELKKGNINQLEFNKAAKALDIKVYGEAEDAIKRLNTDFNNGVVNVKEYNEALSLLKEQKLDESFAEGSITLKEYNKELESIRMQAASPASDSFASSLSAGFQQGFASVVESAGNLETNIAAVTANAFKGLEDQLFNLVREGKFQFKDFANSIIDDLTRMAVRMLIVKNLAKGLTGLFGTTPQAGDASGGGQIGGTQAPTTIETGGGTNLRSVNRGGGGSGVVVNVINNGDANIETQERTAPNGQVEIDVIVNNAVNAGIGRGDFDQAFESTYGLRRRG